MVDYNILESEQIEKSNSRMFLYGVHRSPVKKVKKCVNKKTRTYSKNVIIKVDPNSKEWIERVEKLKKKIADKNKW